MKRAAPQARPEPSATAKRKPIPFEFVLDELAPLEPVTRPMFGSTAVYVDDRMVLVLREKEAHPEDNGVWLATTQEHHPSLRPLFPSMRSVGLMGAGVTSWQVLPHDAPDFESSVRRACELVTQRDPRIGKAPSAGRAKKSASAGEKKGASAKRGLGRGR